MTVIWWFSKEPSELLDMTYIDERTSEFIKHCLLMLREYRQLKEKAEWLEKRNEELRLEIIEKDKKIAEHRKHKK